MKIIYLLSILVIVFQHQCIASSSHNILADTNDLLHSLQSLDNSKDYSLFNEMQNTMMGEIEIDEDLLAATYGDDLLVAWDEEETQYTVHFSDLSKSKSYVDINRLIIWFLLLTIAGLLLLNYKSSFKRVRKFSKNDTKILPLYNETVLSTLG